MNTPSNLANERGTGQDTLVTVCASCKRQRDDHGQWIAAEDLRSAGAARRISHGICPDCVRSLYPELREHHTRILAASNDFVIQACG